MDRKLIGYLPPPLRDIREYAAALSVEQIEFEDLWKALRSAPDEKFTQTATEIGISHWERVLGIAPFATDTLEDRRFRVRTALLDDSRMNYAVLVEKLTALCGEGAFSVDYRPDEYYFGVLIALRSIKEKSEALAMLEEDVPADFILLVDMLYATYGMLSNITYGEMGAYTCRQLREDEDFIKRLGG